MTPRQAKTILYLAAIYNISGGLGIIFFLELLAPLVGLTPGGPLLFRLFVGGTAITFGLAYAYCARSARPQTALLAFGTGLKYWAFTAALLAYLLHDLSLTMLLIFGVANLIFALLFTAILRTSTPSSPTPRRPPQ